jgi:hypothetical protein
LPAYIKHCDSIRVVVTVVLRANVGVNGASRDNRLRNLVLVGFPAVSVERIEGFAPGDQVQIEAEFGLARAAVAKLAGDDGEESPSL